MPRIRALLLAATALAIVPAQAQALEGVVASIKPVHSLVAGVMKGAGEPHLLVRGAGSPHTYSLRPSDARALESAGLVFWVGPRMEVALDSAIDTLGGNATVVELGEAHDLVKLPFREGGPFEGHDHEDEHGHEADSAGHDDHDHAEDGHEESAEHHDDEDGHGHEEAAEAEHDDHGHDGFDMHVWLDPRNAAAMVHEIEEALSEADPDNAALYAGNAEALRARLNDLQTELAAELAPVKDKPFVVFHDAYQYFESRFGLHAAGSITVSPEVMPGAERLREIQQRVRELGATCVFAEPQFEPRLVTVAIEGTGAGSGTLDPLGAELADGPDLYFELMRGMAASLRDCLAGAG
ncbi:MAG: zinc ABC transporter substrate-binding protein [Rhizobiaceae bacterium]